MHRQAKPIVFIGLLMLANYVPLSRAAAASLTGIVIDLGAENPAHSGIAGVWIVVKDAKDKEVGSGLTDAQGAYKVDYSIPANRLTAFYEKLGFQPRPIKREITDVKDQQPPVLMVKEAETDQYYQVVARRLGGEESLPQEQVRERTAIVAALPQAEKSRVKDHLKKQGAVNVLRNIEIAELDIETKSRGLENQFFAGGRSGLGYMIGGSGIGAAIGALAGGVGGYVYADRIAKRHEELAGKENDLDARIAFARGVNEDTLEYNARLKKELSELEAKITELALKKKNQKITQRELEKEKQVLEAKVKDASKLLVVGQDQLQDLKKFRAGQKKSSKELDEEIETLEQNLARMKSNTSALASLNQRI